MKKSIWIVAFSVVLTVLLSAFVFAGSNAKMQVLIPNADGKAIAVSATDGIFYLPSSADLTKIVLSSDREIIYGGKALQAGEAVDITPHKTKDERGAECYRLSLSVGGKTESCTFYHDGTLSSVFVSTSLGLSAIDGDKEFGRDKNAQIVILNGDGSAEYSDLEADTTSEIKSRGNATWTYMKKAYQIKLDSKTDLFGMGKAKTWILLANYTDQSMLHNALGFTLGDALNLPYNIDYRFINLYVDGEYRGLYMLTEKVQIGDNRVDITDLEGATEDANPDMDLEDGEPRTVTSGALIDNTILESYTYCEGIQSPADITGGYLVELDGYGLSEPSHFVTENGNIYSVKSPEYASREEVEYIAGLFADMEEAIYSDTGYNRKGIHYTEYIDMESFAGVYTVQELMKNWDAYTGSMFFFKDADQNGDRAKIYMGPLWDLDNTLGNIRFDKYFFDDTSFLWAQNGVFQNYVRTFAKNLMEHTDFQYEVAEQYAVAYSTVQSALAENGWFAESAEEIRGGVMMDRTRWKLYDSNSWLLSQYGFKSSVKFIQFEDYGTAFDTTKDTALGFMRYYLSARAEALLSSIGTAETPPPITPPEGSSSSSSSSQITTPTTSSDTESSVTSTPGQTNEGEQPQDKPTGTTPIVIITLALIGTAIIVALVFLIIKKKDCPCNKK